MRETKHLNWFWWVQSSWCSMCC